MGQILRATDTAYALRFIRLFTMPWKKTKAHKMGIIDDKGKLIRLPSTADEKSAYTIFHRLVFNLRRIVQKTPAIGKNRLTNYLAAFWLLRESNFLTETETANILHEVFSGESLQTQLNEEVSWLLTEDGKLPTGTYTLGETTLLPKTFEPLAIKGSVIYVSEDTAPHAMFHGIPIFKVKHCPTQMDIYVTESNIVELM